MNHLRRNDGFSLVNVMVAAGVAGLLMAGIATMTNFMSRSVRSTNISLSKQGMSQSILTAVTSKAVCGGAFPGLKLESGWSEKNVSTIHMGSAPIVSVGVVQDGLKATQIKLKKTEGPFAIKIRTSEGPPPVIADMSKYFAELTIDWKKEAAPGQVNVGGDAMKQDSILISLIVDAGGNIHGCYGGQSDEFFASMCEDQLGGTFNPSRFPACLMKNQIFDASFDTRDALWSLSAASTHSLVGINGSLVFGGTENAGTWANGSNQLRSWIGKCTSTTGGGCNLGGEVGANYLHFSGWVDPNFPVGGPGNPDSTRVMALFDHVILPIEKARLGIGTGGRIPAGQLNVHSQQGQGIITISGAGDGPGHNETYSALYLAGDNPFSTTGDDTSIGRNSWVIAHKRLQGSPNEESLIISKWTNGGLLPYPFVFKPNGDLVLQKLKVTDVEATRITATEVFATSDARLKSDLRPIESALAKLTDLRGMTYEFKDKPGARHMGLIAQDVERVFPEAVSQREDGLKTISYGALTAPLIEAVKELKTENDRLQRRLAELERKVETLSRERRK